MSTERTGKAFGDLETGTIFYNREGVQHIKVGTIETRPGTAANAVIAEGKYAGLHAYLPEGEYVEVED